MIAKFVSLFCNIIKPSKIKKVVDISVITYNKLYSVYCKKTISQKTSKNYKKRIPSENKSTFGG